MSGGMPSGEPPWHDSSRGSFATRPPLGPWFRAFTSNPLTEVEVEATLEGGGGRGPAALNRRGLPDAEVRLQDRPISTS